MSSLGGWLLDLCVVFCAVPYRWPATECHRWFARICGKTVSRSENGVSHPKRLIKKQAGPRLKSSRWSVWLKQRSIGAEDAALETFQWRAAFLDSRIQRSDCRMQSVHFRIHPWNVWTVCRVCRGSLLCKFRRTSTRSTRASDDSNFETLLFFNKENLSRGLPATSVGNSLVH